MHELNEVRIDFGSLANNGKDHDAKSVASSCCSETSGVGTSCDTKCLHHNNDEHLTPADIGKLASSSLKNNNNNNNKDNNKEPPFIASVDTGENYYDLFRQTRSLYEFKTPIPSKKFQQPREVPRPVVLGAVDVMERFVQRILYETFSIVRFFLAIVVTILTETLKLVVRGLIQPLIVAFITIIGSHFLQPVLVSFFNYILQPYLSFVNNVLAMVQQTLQPWFMMVGHLLAKVAEVLRAIRLVEVNMAGSPNNNNNNKNQPQHQPQTPMHQV